MPSPGNGGLFASSAHTHATPSPRMVFELVRECVAQRTLLVSGLGNLDKGMQRPPMVCRVWKALQRACERVRRRLSLTSFCRIRRRRTQRTSVLTARFRSSWDAYVSEPSRTNLSLSARHHLPLVLRVRAS